MHNTDNVGAPKAVQGWLDDGPSPTPGLLITLVILATKRDRAIAKHGSKGFRKCRRKIVGPVRTAFAARTLPANVVSIAAMQSPAFARYLETERHAAEVLRSVCVQCRGCRLSRRAA